MKMDSEKAKKQINIRVTDEQYAALAAKAAKAGKSVSGFVRDLALGYKPRAVLDPETFAAFSRAMNGIGRNVNQIARYCNQDKTAPQASALMEVLQQIGAAWEVVRTGKVPAEAIQPTAPAAKTAAADEIEATETAEVAEVVEEAAEAEKPRVPTCERCGASMVWRKRGNGGFWGCPNWRDLENGEHSMFQPSAEYPAPKD